MNSFFKTTIFAAFLWMLCAWNLNAQFESEKFPGFLSEERPAIEKSIDYLNLNNSLPGRSEEVLLFEGFEDGLPTTWTTVDADGDGNKWREISTESHPTLTPHSGQGFVASDSYLDQVALYPDNWLISPAIVASGAVSLQFFIGPQDLSYPAEHYAVYISTTGTAISDFTLVPASEETFANGAKSWNEKNFYLGEYTGNIHIAFRHFNTSNQFRLNLDDVKIYSGQYVPAPYPAPIDLRTIVAPNGSVELSWRDTTASYRGWLTYSTGSKMNSSIAVTSAYLPANYGYYSRWTPADMAALNLTAGKFLSQIQFYVYRFEGMTLKARIYQGGSAPEMPGTIVAEEDIDMDALTISSWATHTFQNPIPIDITKELWFGIEVTQTATGGYMLLWDNSNQVEERNIVRWRDGIWQPLNRMNATYTGNLMLFGRVVNQQGETVDISQNSAKSFKVYCDGGIITSVTDPSYIHENPVYGDHNYCVTAMYEGGHESASICDHVTVPNPNAGSWTCETGPSFPFRENFDTYGLSANLPPCWSSQSVTGNAVWQKNQAMIGNPPTTHSGNFKLRIYNMSTTDEISKLVSPVLNLGCRESATLSFWHTQNKKSSGVYDLLKVYYRTADDAEWILLAEYNDVVATWTKRTIALPNPTATYRVAFEATVHNGYSVQLDDVEILSEGDVVSSGAGATNLTAATPHTPNWYEVHLTWNAPENTANLLGYNLYRNGYKVSGNTLLSATSFVDITPCEGEYTYAVEAVWSDKCPSDRTTTTVVMNEDLCGSLWQVPFSESFDEEQYPPFCWQNSSTTEATWKRVTEGTTPDCATHSGTAMLQYDAQTYPSGNTGLIVTPAFMGNNSYLLKFWMYRDAGMPEKSDKINVYINTTPNLTGATLLSTIHRAMALVPEVSTEGWHSYSIALPTGNMNSAYLIFEGISDSGQNIYIDDIAVEEHPCGVPGDVTAQITYNGTFSAQIAWEAPTTGENSFNVYRDNVCIASNLSATSYTDTNPSLGQHTWCISSVCGEVESTRTCITETCTIPTFTITASASDGGSISPSGNITVSYGDNQTFIFNASPHNSVTEVLVDGVNKPEAVAAGEYEFTNVTDNHTIQANFAHSCSDAEAPVDLTASIHHEDWYDVKLSWKDPAINGNLAYALEGNQSGAIGLNSGDIMAIRFAPEDLAEFDGDLLSKVSFMAPNMNNCGHTLKIWKGGGQSGSTFNSGTEIHSQVINTAHFTWGYQWNTITLTTPITIDPTQELWIGISFTGAGYTGTYEPGTIAKAGYSNLIYRDNTWKELNTLLASWTYDWRLAGIVTQGGAQVIGYNVYRDNVLLNAENLITDYSYIDVVPGAGNYLYEVSTIYDDQCESVERAQATIDIGVSPCDEMWQAPFSESFDAEKFAPWCWTSSSTTDSPWIRVTSGSVPTCQTHSGAGMLQYSNYFYSEGKKGILATPKFVGNNSYTLRFWMYRDNKGSYGGVDFPDKVNVYLNNEPNAENATMLLSVYRCALLEPVVETEGWYEYTAQVSTAGMDGAYIIFEGVSGYGNNIFVDDISIEQGPCDAPQNVNVNMMYNGNCGAEITWTTPAAGSGIYNVYRDNTKIASNITTTSYTDTDFTLGTHTWCVKSVCGSFESDPTCVTGTCSIPTFTIAASATTGGMINPQGNISVVYDGSRTFTFTANLGYELKEVLVDGSNVPEAVAAKSYTFNHVAANHTIQAVFEKVKYTITAIAEENGSIDPMGEVQVSHGDSKTFTIIAEPGYTIDKVLVDGINNPAAVSNGSYTFSNVTAPHTISATFTTAQYIITATAGTGGSITPSGIVGASGGDTKTFFIVPNAGYKITQVLVDGIANQEAMSGSYTFYNIAASHTISATFEHAYSVITATAGEGGTVTPAGVTQVLYGQSRHYTITPHFGYKIATVLVDGANNAAAVENGSYLFVNVTSDHSIAATFERIPHTIVSEAGTGGSISPSGSTQVADGGTQTYSITVNEGYTLTKVLVDGTNNEAAVSAKTYTFSNVTENHTIRAFFEISCYTLEAIAGENGTIAPTGIITVNHGGSKTYTFTPNAGYIIDKVLIDGTNDETAVTEGAYTFENVTENHAIEVSFKVTTSTITATVEGGNGTIDPEGETTVDYGASQIYTFTPNEGYGIAEVLVDGVSKPGAVQNGSYTFNNVTTDHEIIVKFSEKTAIDEGEMTTLKVYPNPTTGKITIKYTSLAGRPGWAVLVFDITGRLVLEVNNVDNNKTEIDLSNYADGVYFIRVDGKTTKVVKR